MRKSHLFLFSLLITVFITFFSTKVSYYKHHHVGQYVGFPFELGSIYPPTGLVVSGSSFPIIPYLLNFSFWFFGCLAFIFLNRHPKKKTALIFVLITGFLLMLVDTKTSSSCLGGYPIGFLSFCSDVKSPNNPAMVFALVDFSFWLVIALFGSLLLSNTKNSSSRLAKLFIPPFLLTLFSLVFQSECHGFICFFPTGRGFPIPFTGSNINSVFGILILILIDYIFWWIVYNIILLVKHNLQLKRSI